MKRIVLVIAILIAGLVQSGWAQKKVLTAAYLRASVGALDERSSVVVRAEYLGSPGMVAAEGRGLRNKGFSRFSIRDPETGAVFDSMYCKQESDVFWRLLKSKTDALLVFRGEKSRGEDREDAIMVDRLENVLLSPSEVAARVAKEEPVEVKQPQLRVTLVDEETGVRTVLTHIERGTPVRVDGLMIVVEDETPPGN